MPITIEDEGDYVKVPLSPAESASLLTLSPTNLTLTHVQQHQPQTHKIYLTNSTSFIQSYELSVSPPSLSSEISIDHKSGEIFPFATRTLNITLNITSFQDQSQTIVISALNVQHPVVITATMYSPSLTFADAIFHPHESTHSPHRCSQMLNLTKLNKTLKSPLSALEQRLLSSQSIDRIRPISEIIAESSVVEMNFPNGQLNHDATECIMHMRNDTPLPVTFSILEATHFPFSPPAWAKAKDPNAIERYHHALIKAQIFTLDSGPFTLLPNQKLNITIKFNRHKSGSYRLPYLFSVDGGKKITLLLNGTTLDGQTGKLDLNHLPSITLEQFKKLEVSCEFQDCYLHQLHSIPVHLFGNSCISQTVTLYNDGNEPLKYVIEPRSSIEWRWAEAELSGIIQSRSSRIVRVIVQPNNTNEINQVVYVHTTTDEKTITQCIVLQVNGINPKQNISLTFPNSSLDYQESHSTLFTNKMLAHISHSIAAYGTLPTFAMQSRLFWLRSNCQYPLKFEFYNKFTGNVKPPSHIYNNLNLYEQECTDLQESATLFISPQCGVIPPFSSTPITIWIYGGNKPQFIDRDIRCNVEAVPPSEQKTEADRQNEINDDLPIILASSRGNLSINSVATTTRLEVNGKKTKNQAPKHRSSVVVPISNSKGYQKELPLHVTGLYQRSVNQPQNVESWTIDDSVASNELRKSYEQMQESMNNATACARITRKFYFSDNLTTSVWLRISARVLTPESIIEEERHRRSDQVSEVANEYIEKYMAQFYIPSTTLSNNIPIDVVNPCSSSADNVRSVLYKILNDSVHSPSVSLAYQIPSSTQVPSIQSLLNGTTITTKTESVRQSETAEFNDQRDKKLLTDENYHKIVSDIHSICEGITQKIYDKKWDPSEQPRLFLV